MQKPILRAILWALLTGLSADAVAQVAIATVHNSGLHQVVLVYKYDRAVLLKPGDSERVSPGDVISTLAGGIADIRYQDGCRLSLDGNQRLPIKKIDQNVACHQRADSIQKIETFAAIGAPAQIVPAVVPTTTTAAAVGAKSVGATSFFSSTFSAVSGTFSAVSAGLASTGVVGISVGAAAAATSIVAAATTVAREDDSQSSSEEVASPEEL